ncbi:MAG TPA: AbrB/MazE/SpoVT family DNA-binding domain-containing protein [Candidatus Thermoplasmatota archaeon]|nr:AbrB/MazE/SpoVT family DNA-binding domain-containing protein [Candidatus Thermoplasmatota archaeon]
MVGQPEPPWESKPYRIDAQNRIYIPEEIRDALNVQRGDVLAFRRVRGKVSLHRVSYRVED